MFNLELALCCVCERAIDRCDYYHDYYVNAMWMCQQYVMPICVVNQRGGEACVLVCECARDMRPNKMIGARLAFERQQQQQNNDTVNDDDDDQIDNWRWERYSLSQTKFEMEVYVLDIKRFFRITLTTQHEMSQPERRIYQFSTFFSSCRFDSNYLVEFDFESIFLSLNMNRETIWNEVGFRVCRSNSNYDQLFYQFLFFVALKSTRNVN